jgi:hypothetical protein
MLVLLLLAMGGLAASQLLPPQQKQKIQAEARTLVKRGVEEVTSVIQQAAAPRRPEALDEKQLGGELAKNGASAALPGDEDGKRSRRRQTTVTLVTNPPGAEVLGPSGKLGVTPMPYNMRVGTSERLTFRKEGYAEVERRITGKRKETTVTVDLQPQAQR